MDAARVHGGLLNQQAFRYAPTGQRMAVVVDHGPGAVNYGQAHVHTAPVGAPLGGVPPLGNVIGGIVREALGRAGVGAPAHFPQQGAWPVPPGGFPPHTGGGFPPHYNQHYQGSDLNDRSVLLIRAMISAAAADGGLDRDEQDRIVSQLGYLTPDERQFLRQEFSRPLDPHEIGHATPPGMEGDVYAAALMAINLDTNPEGAFLVDLSKCLRIPPQGVNQIHAQMGAPCLFR